MSTTSAYLGSYDLSSSGNNTYTLNFTIPDNCNCRSTGSNGLYCIDIDLNSGQTQPSTTFVPYTEIYASYNNALSVTFDQPNGSSKRTKKPTLTIAQ